MLSKRLVLRTWLAYIRGSGHYLIKILIRLPFGLRLNMWLLLLDLHHLLRLSSECD